ncbi:MAG: protein-disulfide reductase DsbD family protein, partial [Flavobacteriales bacterium]
MREPIKKLLALLAIAAPLVGMAQDPGAGFPDPVKWTIASKDLGGGFWEVTFQAAIEKGWAVYSQQAEEMGPIPTLIVVDTTGGVAADGLAQESGAKVIEGLDPVFGIPVKKFKESAAFAQRIRVADPTRPVTGYFEYMACDDERCTPPTAVYYIVGLASGTYALGDVSFDPNDPRFAGIATRSDAAELRLPHVNLDEPVVRDEGARAEKESSLWWIFVLGFIGGLVALLTPCVFPMIPLTVSFFTKSSQDRATGLKNALTYGGFIFLIYLLFSLPFHLLGSVNPEIFNEISTNPWLNIGFFVIFIVFAISFFGYFEITLPSSWVNKMDSNASRYGGLIGTFFMALTLALVSVSCTGPILGSLLAGALTPAGGAWQLTAGMGGFGLALALPFGLFALFPGWLSSLPRSGSWLNSVKVVLGF